MSTSEQQPGQSYAEWALKMGRRLAGNAGNGDFRKAGGVLAEMLPALMLDMRETADQLDAIRRDLHRIADALERLAATPGGER
jgi:hypothetical protein